jgi:hypothetical protein
LKAFETQLDQDPTLRADDELKHMRLVARFLTHQLKTVCATIAQLRYFMILKTFKRLKMAK